MQLVKVDDVKDCFRLATLLDPMIDKYSDTLLELADKIPVVEAEPVRHGRWIHNRDTGEVRCPYCNALWGIGTRYDEVVGDGRYCFYCGTKMDGGTDNG